MDDIEDKLNSIFTKYDLHGDKSELFRNEIISAVVKHLDSLNLQTNLDLLYDYEKNYLPLLKDYKNEIEFIIKHQENLRQEEVSFFENSLKEISQIMSDIDVEPNIRSKWLIELVENHKKSLGVSRDFLENNTVELIAKLKNEINRKIEKIKYS